MYIPVAAPDTATFPGSDYYKLNMAQYTEQVHPDLPKATTFWGYADATKPTGSAVNKYLGPVIVAKRDRPVRLKVSNKLPNKFHFLPVDVDPFFMDAQTYQSKTSVHLHGGFVPWISDGGPYAWFTPANPGLYGPDHFFVPDMPVPELGAFTYYYPNQQSSRLMWYHDHAHDLTRLNAYGGLASAFILRDDQELNLISRGIIPSAEIPLIIQDKGFKNANPRYVNQYPQWETPIGDLWYPYLYEGPPLASQTLPPGPPFFTGRWNALSPISSNGILPTVPSVVPEAFFDTIMINGAVYPYLNVQPKRYRFRILNGSQARVFNLQLYMKDNSADGITLVQNGVDPNGNPVLVPNNAPGPKFIQIGNECGFLRNHAVLNNPPQPIGYESSGLPTNGNVNRYTLLLAPAERADIIIDFSQVTPGTRLLLYNDAPAPFPGPEIRNDYYTGDFDLTPIGGAPPTQPGYGPNTRTLMEIRVGALTSPPDPFNFDSTVAALNTELPAAYDASQPPDIPDSTAVRTRHLTLNEDIDTLGRLLQRLGTDVQIIPGTYGRFYDDPPTETPRVGDIERWRIFNYTGDTHPIHLHLVNAKLRARQAFDTTQPPTDAALIGNPRGPDANEKGWKETIRMNPGEATTLTMQFNLPTVPFPVRLSTRTGIQGHEYVWHCHILEHEEHDMMRPLIVVP
jgi:spore coat protein A